MADRFLDNRLFFVYEFSINQIWPIWLQ